MYVLYNKKARTMLDKPDTQKQDQHLIKKVRSGRKQLAQKSANKSEEMLTLAYLLRRLSQLHKREGAK